MPIFYFATPNTPSYMHPIACMSACLVGWCNRLSFASDVKPIRLYQSKWCFSSEQTATLYYTWLCCCMLGFINWIRSIFMVPFQNGLKFRNRIISYHITFIYIEEYLTYLLTKNILSISRNQFLILKTILKIIDAIAQQW